MSGEVPRVAPTRRLPSHPNLTQLRKQAKDLLTAYRAGDAAATAEVQRFERDPIPASFALNDAQRVLARAYGFASWPRLKASVDGANVEQLTVAVKEGDIGRVGSLLNARPELVGMDLNEGNEHRALHFAVLQRDVAVTRLLMKAGADARQGIWPHRDATSALAIARERGYVEIVAEIEEVEIARRRELSCPNATISPAQDKIAAAIRAGDRDTAIRLLEEDSSLIHACDRSGRTPLHIAAEESDEQMVSWLMDRGVNPNKRDREGQTPLDRAATAADPRNNAAAAFPGIARYLLEHGAELTLFGAVAMGDQSVVRAFVCTDPAVLRRIGSSGGLLSLAVNHEQIDVVRLLLELGADVDERIVLEHLDEPASSWGMPLWYAALANQFEIAKLLLDRGADPNANVYASGWPLRNAWNHPDGRLKQLLLQRGATPQPYMLSETHDVAAARRLLEADASEGLAQELAWSAADNGCAAILEMALPRIVWPRDSPR